MENKELGPDYYDKVYETGGKNGNYLKPYLEAAHYPIWKQMCSWIKKSDKILELGCGTGQMAKMLFDEGYDYIFGVDFSEKAINHAKKLTNLGGNVLFKDDITNPNYNFYAKENYDVVIATEVLEHINNDLHVLEKIASGTSILATVPDFECTGHVRHFKNEEEIRARYKHLMYIHRIIPFTGKHTIFLIVGRRK